MADIGLEYAFYEVDEKIRFVKSLCIEQIHDIQVNVFHFLSHLTGWQISISLFLIITVTLLVRLSIHPLSDLRFRYSLLSCWKELLVMMDRSHCQPFLLRLAFADAVTYDHTISDWPYCGGCNGSIRFDSELNEPFNAGMVNAISILLPFKRRYGKLISWADLIQMAGAAAVYSLGGPYIELRYGREDVDVDLRYLTFQEEVRHRIANGASFHTPTSEDLQANIVFPKVFPPYPRGEMRAEQHLRSIFQRLGLTNREAVALMGAHTCGRAFQDRSGCCPFSSGDQGATIYTKLTAEAHVSSLSHYVGFVYFASPICFAGYSEATSQRHWNTWRM